MGCAESQPIPETSSSSASASPDVVQLAPPGTGFVSAAQQSDWEKQILKAHNDARALAGLPPLTWNAKLAENARLWAEHLNQKEQCVLRHPTASQQELDTYVPDGEGQNLYSGFGYPKDPSTPASAVSNWYNECKDYTPSATDAVPKNFEAVGHFTQLMWKNAEQLGCGVVKCAPKTIDLKNPMSNGATKVQSLGSVIACNYDRGNMSGQFYNMVAVPPSGKCPMPSDVLS